MKMNNVLILLLFISWPICAMETQEVQLTGAQEVHIKEAQAKLLPSLQFAKEKWTAAKIAGLLDQSTAERTFHDITNIFDDFVDLLVLSNGNKEQQQSLLNEFSNTIETTYKSALQADKAILVAALKLKFEMYKLQWNYLIDKQQLTYELMIAGSKLQEAINNTISQISEGQPHHLTSLVQDIDNLHNFISQLDLPKPVQQAMQTFSSKVHRGPIPIIIFESPKKTDVTEEIETPLEETSTVGKIENFVQEMMYIPENSQPPMEESQYFGHEMTYPIEENNQPPEQEAAMLLGKEE